MDYSCISHVWVGGKGSLGAVVECNVFLLTLCTHFLNVIISPHNIAYVNDLDDFSSNCIELSPTLMRERLWLAHPHVQFGRSLNLVFTDI